MSDLRRTSKRSIAHRGKDWIRDALRGESSRNRCGLRLAYAIQVQLRVRNIHHLRAVRGNRKQLPAGIRKLLAGRKLKRLRGVLKRGGPAMKQDRDCGGAQ